MMRVIEIPVLDWHNRSAWINRLQITAVYASLQPEDTEPSDTQSHLFMADGMKFLVPMGIHDLLELIQKEQ